MKSFVVYLVIMLINIASGTEVPDDSKMVPSDWPIKPGETQVDLNACTTTSGRCTVGLYAENGDYAACFTPATAIRLCIFDQSCVTMQCFDKNPTTEPFKGAIPWTAETDKLNGNIYITAIDTCPSTLGIDFGYQDETVSSDGGCDCEQSQDRPDGTTVKWCRCEFDCRLNY